MKRMKLIVMAGLVVALCTPAWAVTVPSLPTPYVYVESTDHTNGTNYQAVETGTFVRDNSGTTGDVTDDTWTNTNSGNVYTYTSTVNGQNTWTHGGSGNTFVATQAPGAVNGEDTWGIYALEVIRPGNPIPVTASPGTYVSMGQGGDKIYEWDAGADTGLVALYYGGEDVQVTVNADASFTVWVENLILDLYAAPTSEIDGDEEGTGYDPARRTAQNAYADWVEPSDPDWVPLLQLESDSFKFSGSFTPAGFFNGTTTVYASATDENSWAWNPLVRDYPDLFGWDDGRETGTSDAWFFFAITNDDQDPNFWTAKSIDNGGFGAVPEPLTMLAVSGAVMGLGGYIRRRRRD
jgi:hypothetical protein